MAAVVLAYWLVYVLGAPVTTADSHIYNASRLLVAERGGLFGNPPWTNYHQIVFPWGFDAVHLPFLKLGRLENLPSFLCLLGLAAVAALLCRRQGTPECAPVAVLLLLASPTVVFQATTSKNDLATAFFALAAFYFLLRSREDRGRVWLAAFAVSIGLCAGAKTTGLLIAAMLLAAAVWVFARQGPGRFWEFAIAAAASLLLFGSFETYLDNRLLFGSWMGPPDFIAMHRNPDGVAGAFASLVRYGFNSLGTGLESEALTRDYRVWLTESCTRLLGWLGMARETGLAPVEGGDPKFLMGAHEVASNYGLAGLAALTLAVAALARDRWRSAAGWLAIMGFVTLALLCATAGWQKFNMRLLLPSAVPLLVSGALFLAPFLKERPGWRLALQIALFALALAVPLCSWNRNPRFIRWAWEDRAAVEMQERLPLIGEWKGVHELARANNFSGVAVILGPNDWALPYLQDRRLRWFVIPNRDARPQISLEEIRRALPPKARGTWLLVASQGNAAVRLPGHAKLAAEYPSAGRACAIELDVDR